MAVMGRKKQMVKQMIEFNKGKYRDINQKQQEKNKESDKHKMVADEEHKKRIELLKNIGLLKEGGQNV